MGTYLFLGIVLLFVVRKFYADRNRRKGTIAFFHPYCEAGGGGERVLWCCIRAIQDKFPDLHCVIYSATEVEPAVLAEKASRQFGIEVDGTSITVVRLASHALLQGHRYSRLTLLLQSLASMLVAFEALFKLTPELFFDTTGFAFTLPIAKLYFKCKTLCYIHYPTISRDMLKQVERGVSGFNNAEAIAASPLRTRVKMWYYKGIALLYRLSGKCADLVMTNSSWTAKNIETLWRTDKPLNVADTHPALAETETPEPLNPSAKPCFILYPPCPIKDLASGDAEEKRSDVVLSVAQFRPEKNHSLQLAVFKKALTRLREESGEEPSLRLVLVGAVRNKEDEARVTKLRAQATALEIADKVEFVVNADYTVVVDYLRRSLVGLHTMRKEHFGICVVEYMAAGCMTIAHGSAGPRRDIVVTLDGRPTGFLARTMQEYVDAICTVVQLPEQRQLAIRKAARAQAKRFDQELFYGRFERCLLELLPPHQNPAA